jgi:hypothetical protein
VRTGAVSVLITSQKLKSPKATKPEKPFTSNQAALVQTKNRSKRAKRDRYSNHRTITNSQHSRNLPESTSSMGQAKIIHDKQVKDNKNPKFNPYQHQQQSHKPSISNLQANQASNKYQHRLKPEPHQIISRLQGLRVPHKQINHNTINNRQRIVPSSRVFTRSRQQDKRREASKAREKIGYQSQPSTASELRPFCIYGKISLSSYSSDLFLPVLYIWKNLNA